MSRAKPPRVCYDYHPIFLLTRNTQTQNNTYIQGKAATKDSTPFLLSDSLAEPFCPYNQDSALNDYKCELPLEKRDSPHFPSTRSYPEMGVEKDEGGKRWNVVERRVTYYIPLGTTSTCYSGRFRPEYNSYYSGRFRPE